MAKNQVAYPKKIDITNCDKEPIHIIGKSQAHGVILACNPQSFEVTQCGQNTHLFFGKTYDEILGQNLENIIGGKSLTILKGKLENKAIEAIEVEVGGRNFLMLPHFSGADLVIDFEERGELWDSMFYQRQLTRILNGLSASESIEDLCDDAAGLTRDIFGYDRVMIYKFDEEWNGEVIAEEKKESLESWLGLHYPASDIPAQSRQIFLKHRVRIIVDVNYRPVPIIPELSPHTGEPLDLSKSELRGVSPIHIEYLQNMKVGASLTAAIIANGKLWGLVACHHYSTKFVNYFQRETCKFLTQVFSNQLALKDTGKYLEKNTASEKVRTKILQQMREQDKLSEALTNSSSLFTQLINCGGGAVVLNGNIFSVGKTPTENQIKHLLHHFLAEKQEHLFFTKNLEKVFPPAGDYREQASGVLSIQIGQDFNNYLLWFREEAPKTVNWGGNPENKASYNEEKQRLSPRKSFEKWSQKLTGVSDSWKAYEIAAAKALAEDVSHIIVEKQKEEISRLNDELLDANDELELFSYSISHDLRGPLRGIDGYLRIMKEDFGEEIPEELLQLINTTLGSAEKMNQLIDDILSLSRIGRGEIRREEMDVNAQISEILESLNPEAAYPKTQIKIENLPKLQADEKMMRQVWANLIGNALKYSAESKSPMVKIGANKEDNSTVYFVKDNGIGISEEKQNAVFNAFERYAGSNYSGTGIGLAVVKRIIEKHQGEVWVESSQGTGSTFKFRV